MINKIKKWSIDFFAKEDSTYHILAFLISSVLFPTIPIIWFIVFMKEKMIFSYDFFTNGMFGLSIFFFISLILLLLFGFLLVGSVVFLVIIIYKIKEDSSINYLYLYLFFFMFIFNILGNYTIKLPEGFFVYIFIFNLFLFLHIGVLSIGKGFDKFITLIIFIIVFSISTNYYQTIISSFIEYGLLQFRMGGNIKTKIIDMKNHENTLEGNLTLLTPNKVFLHRDKTITIFNRDNIIIEIMDKNITK